MWMIKPSLLCNRHLLGEHGEIHKHRHNFIKKHSIKGRIFPIVQIEPQSMSRRHELLAAEMSSRGLNHKSPYEMPDISYLSEDIQKITVDTGYSIQDLNKRCPECRARLLNYNNIKED